MEISRDSILRVIKATRMSLSMADDMRKLMVNPKGRTFADVIAGFLSDAVFTFCGEKLRIGQDFFDSRTMKILTDKRAGDDEALREIMRIYRDNHPEQPKPHFTDREEMKKQAAQGCGYMAPEGDWT